jgi:hypothetical protein
MDHPDVVSGRSADDIILGGPDRYFDPTAFSIPLLRVLSGPRTGEDVVNCPFVAGSTTVFESCAGRLGTSGRNQLTGPSLVNLDLSLTKEANMPWIGEAGKLEFRAEFFNVLNHANFNIPTTGRTVYTANETTATPAPLSTAGQIDRTVSSNRQVQLALKLIF